MSKKYYDKLFKEYCISDLTYYKENKIALRWRIEKEVVLGKGQFICGNKTCQEQEHLRTWEVNFAYIEKGEKKNALIKLSKLNLKKKLIDFLIFKILGLCPPCSEKLNYKSKKREIKRQKHTQRKQSDKRRSKSKKSEISEASSSESIPDNKALESTSNSDIEECSGEQEANIWDGKDKAVDSIVREDEFGKYLEDLLL